MTEIWGVRLEGEFPNKLFWDDEETENGTKV